MSHMSHRARRLALASTAALAALGATGSTAQAASVSLDYQCKYPLIGVQPLKIDIDASITSAWTTGTETPPFEINAVATAGGTTGKAIEAIGAKTLEGVAAAAASIRSTDGSVLPLKVPITVSKWTRPASVPSPLVLAARGQTPSLGFDQPGTVQVTVDKLSLNLKATDGSGAAIPLAPATTDVDGAPVTPSDSDAGTFDVPCKLAPGQATTLASFPVSAPGPADLQAPSKPGALKATATASLASLTWAPATDNVRVEFYDVYQGSTKVTSVSGTSALIGGLSPSSTYSFKVVAKDAAGNETPGDPVSVSTSAAGDPGPGGSTISYGYSILGASSLRTLTTGSVPVSGGIDAQFNLTTGEFSGELSLNKTRANLSLLSFLPVTAEVAFTQTGPTVGTLEDGVLKATARMKIRLPQLYLLGVIPIAGPGTCQTKLPSNIPLRSTAAFFDPLAGGMMAGSYAISDLGGCGPLNDIISPFAAGGGNTLAIKLTPKA